MLTGLGTSRVGSPSAPLHVLAYTDTPARGGAEVALRSLIAAFSEDVRVTVMGVERPVLEWIASSRPGTPVVVLPRIAGKADLRSMWQHRQAIARIRPDVVHANLVSMWS